MGTFLISWQNGTHLLQCASRFARPRGNEECPHFHFPSHHFSVHGAILLLSL
jgi:hypothetical protein